MEGSPDGIAAQQVEAEEELRLLYVGLTRSRDVLALAVDKGESPNWLDCLQAPWLLSGTDELRLPGGVTLPSKATEFTFAELRTVPEPHSRYLWFPPPLNRTPKPVARLTPSDQPPIPGATVGRVIEYGFRLPITGTPADADMGDALHAFLAAHTERAQTIDVSRVLQPG